MSEREYRRDNSRKRNQDEGDIARYERYRYSSGNTPQYNDSGSTWSMEQLANSPDDIDGTLNHTGGEILDESFLPSMNWEQDDHSRGDPLEDEWDYTDEWLNKTQQVASNYAGRGTRPASRLDVTKLGSIEKLSLAIKRSASAYSSELADELQAIFTPATLATMALCICYLYGCSCYWSWSSC